MKDHQLLDTTITILNEAYAADPVAVGALIEHRVPCNTALADHPTITVAGEEPSVGLLGIINGILTPITGCRVASMHSPDGKLTGFMKYSGVV